MGILIKYSYVERIGIGMSWRLMWRDYREFVTEMFPIVLGIVSLAIVWVAVIASALVIVRWLCL